MTDFVTSEGGHGTGQSVHDSGPGIALGVPLWT